MAKTLNTRYLKVDIVMLSNDSDELALPDNHESYCVTLGVRVCVLLHAVTWRAPVQCTVRIRIQTIISMQVKKCVWPQHISKRI